VVVEGEILPADAVIEGYDFTKMDQLDKLEEILIAIGITGKTAVQLAELALANKREADDLNRLIEYSKNKNPDNLAAYVASMVRKDKYPAIMSTRKVNHQDQVTRE
jgi:hypothetical protein